MNPIQLIEPRPANILTYTSLGMLGGAIASLLANKENLGLIRKHIQDPDVNTEKFVAKYAPEVTAITSQEKLDANKERFGFIDKLILRNYFKNPRNAYYGSGAVIAPEKTNRYILAHELGHYERGKTVKEPSAILDLLGINLMRGKTLQEEKAAWEQAPIKIKDEGIKLQGAALKTYEDAQNYVRAGAATGAGLGLGAILIRKMLQK